MKLDILAFGAHPDDVELGCAGTLIKEIRNGKKVGIIDLTKGELGTRGTPEIRLEESKKALKIIGASVRENLGMKDGFFKNDEAHQLKIIETIRKYRPDIVIANAISDRHPDHGRGSDLVSESCFYSGLRKIQTRFHDKQQEPWRPKVVYHYIQFYDIKPDVLVDISQTMDGKMESIKAFSSQFYDPASGEPGTIISTIEFMDSIRERASILGRIVNCKFAEGFTVERYPGVNYLTSLI